MEDNKIYENNFFEKEISKEKVEEFLKICKIVEDDDFFKKVREIIEDILYKAKFNKTRVVINNYYIDKCYKVCIYFFRDNIDKDGYIIFFYDTYIKSVIVKTFNDKGKYNSYEDYSSNTCYMYGDKVG